jgi:hypothetical protein
LCNILLEVKKDPPPKKKKKKEPPFPTPEWAKELKVIIEKVYIFKLIKLYQVAEIKNYVSMNQEIGLDETFLNKSKEQLSRFAQEIAFRKNEEDILKKLDDDKKKKKKK